MCQRAACLRPSGTTDDVHLGPSATAREEPRIPGKGYEATSAPSRGDEHYKYCFPRTSVYIWDPLKGSQMYTDVRTALRTVREPSLPPPGGREERPSYLDRVT